MGLEQTQPIKARDAMVAREEIVEILFSTTDGTEDARGVSENVADLLLDRLKAHQGFPLDANAPQKYAVIREHAISILGVFKEFDIKLADILKNEFQLGIDYTRGGLASFIAHVANIRTGSVSAVDELETLRKQLKYIKESDADLNRVVADFPFSSGLFDMNPESLAWMLNKASRLGDINDMVVGPRRYWLIDGNFKSVEKRELSEFLEDLDDQAIKLRLELKGRVRPSQ